MTTEFDVTNFDAIRISLSNDQIKSPDGSNNQ